MYYYKESYVKNNPGLNASVSNLNSLYTSKPHGRRVANLVSISSTVVRARYCLRVRSLAPSVRLSSGLGRHLRSVRCCRACRLAHGASSQLTVVSPLSRSRSRCGRSSLQLHRARAYGLPQSPLYSAFLVLSWSSGAWWIAQTHLERKIEDLKLPKSPRSGS